ncbi:hypothetical protein MJM04_28695, partial [Salmonella enterica subsp. enterica serovar Cerro]|nr:hypothetical protein [Salmonella enterica subsp. enterica serovar Cerro]
AHAVAAPGAADAGFRHSQRFGVRVTGFEARFNQLTPDFRQIVYDVVRFFTEQKCRMMPYLYREAARANEAGTPMMRAMMLEFPDD